MMGVPDMKKLQDPQFRKLNKAISKHQYEVTEYSPNGTFMVKKVKIEDTKGRMGKEVFYELRYLGAWRLISDEDFNTLFQDWLNRNKKFLEDNQEAVVQLDHENTEVPTL